MGAIIPFNFPSDIFTHKVARAIAMGNAVVVKPSEEDPLTVAREVELLIEAGLPEGVVEVVFGGADVGAALAADDRIAAVSFTGSTEAGRSVAQSAAKRLAPVFLELGGNDAFVVLSDADVELVVEEAVFGPELSVIPVEGTAEAVATANASRYGLSGSVFSRDISRAMAVAMALDTGQVVINGTGQYRAEVAPFGGFKQSGIGREGLSTSLLELVQNKNVVLRGVVSSDLR